MDFGFIILRHVNSKITNEYWQESYKNIRKFYKNKIIIIDDNSDKKFLTNNFLLENTDIINSEYPKRGELLPYIYFLKYKWFKNAVIIHDSVFIKNKINFDRYNNKFLAIWEFEHNWDQTNLEINKIKLLNNSDELIKFYNNKNNWKGCFGGMSIININYLIECNKKYNINNLIKIIKCRNDRMCLERIIACIFQYKINNKVFSLFGNIHKYCKWGYSFKDYKKNPNNNIPFIKVWSGR